MPSVLDDAARARGYHLQLKGVDFAKELSQEMLNHSVALEKAYSQLQEKVSKELNDEKAYKALFASIEMETKKFDKAEAGSLLSCSSSSILCPLLAPGIGKGHFSPCKRQEEEGRKDPREGKEGKEECGRVTAGYS